MDRELLKYFKVICNIQSSIAKADNIEEALRSGIDVVMKDCGVDYVTVWYEDSKGDSILHPYYWLSPVDLSNKSQRINEGSVGRVYASQVSEKYLDYVLGDDPSSDDNFEGISIGSLVTVPLSNKYDRLGCVQFINSKANKKFTNEDADVFEMLTSFIAIGIDENLKLSKPETKKKVVISVKNIEKSFKNGEIVLKVLKGVNLNVYEGESTFMGKDMFNASEDEPTAALDYDTSIVVLKALDSIAKSGTTLIMVTHNEEITRMADRVVRFRNGKMYEAVVNKHPVHAEDLVW